MQQVLSLSATNDSKISRRSIFNKVTRIVHDFAKLENQQPFRYKYFMFNIVRKCCQSFRRIRVVLQIHL